MDRDDVMYLYVILHVMYVIGPEQSSSQSL